MIQSLEFLGFNSSKQIKCVFISTCSCQQPPQKKPGKARRAKKSLELLAFLAFPCFFTSKKPGKGSKSKEILGFFESLECQEVTLGFQGKPGI